MPNFKKLRKKANQLQLQYLHAKKKREEETEILISLEDQLSTALEAQDILQSLAKAIQEKTHKQISSIVSSCLRSVFDDPYEFKILFEKRRGKTEARLVFCRNGMEVSPLDAAGGGVVDIAAFALRVACLSLTRPTVRKLVVLDEPFRFVSEQNQPKVRALLEQLAERMDFQFIMVTHESELETGKVIEL